MGYVRRDNQGKIIGWLRYPAEGFEELSDDDQEVRTFFNPAPPPRLVPKSLIVSRLIAAGKIAAANAALEADPASKARWYAADRPAIRSEDPEAVAFLQAIGADPAQILGP